jgi:hypothetical protein
LQTIYAKRHNRHDRNENHPPETKDTSHDPPIALHCNGPRAGLSDTEAGAITTNQAAAALNAPITMRLTLMVAMVCTTLGAASAQDRGGYLSDTIFSDGPIIYGTGMSDADRRKAGQHFFFMMLEACRSQQGMDALEVKLAKRCKPGEDFCTIGIDADLVGIGGIQEPRPVLVMVVFDVHDQNKQLARWVCTWPEKGHQVCRDFDTGKLMGFDRAQ